MSETCATRLLPDEPADVDVFGSHQRLARAIADLIANEPGGKSIALTGSYGSGKSTVVRILSQLLRETTSHARPAVFVFDAWAHQGDVLRRAFLETFVAFLTSIAWTKSTKWQSNLELLLGRREQSESTSEPVLTVAGRLVGASALLIPPGAALVSKAGDPSSFLSVRVWVWGLILCLAPLLAAVTTWLFWRPTWRLWRSEFWKQHRAPHENESVLSFFIQKTRETHRVSTVHIPDPTSVEFREMFLRIVEDVLAEPNRRLAIVVDNLDRLASSEALSIWATMRTFVDLETREDHPSLSRLWLLVPFDTRAAHRLIGLTEASDTRETETAFLNKSFQATFRVPPPVLSRWRTFLEDNLARAFPDQKHRDDFQTIFSLYRFKRGLFDTLMTPREIKLFVNKLGGLHRQWCGEIPLPLQALHVLHEENIRDAAKDLTAENFLAPLEIALIGAVEWQRYLAALHYNVPPNDALQVLLGRTVENALIAGDAAALQPLKGISGFAGVCEQVLQQNYVTWAQGEPASLASAALALAELDTPASDQLRPIWQWLRWGLLRIDQWPILRESTGRGLVEILNRFPAAELDSAATHALTRLRDCTVVAEPQPSAPNQITSRVWVRVAEPVVRAVDQAGRAKIITANFSVPGAAAEYVAALVALAEIPSLGDLIRYFRPRPAPQEVVAEFVGRCTSGRFTPETARAVPLLRGGVSADLQWEPLVAALNQRLQATNALQAPEVTGCVSTLLFLAWKQGNAQATSVAQGLAAQGHVLHQLYQARAVKDAEAVGVCTLLVLIFLPAGNVQAHVGNSSPGLNVYQEILRSPRDNMPECHVLARLVVELDQLDALLSVRSTASNSGALISVLLEQIATREDACGILRPEKLVPNFLVLEETLSVDVLRSLIGQLVSKGGLTDYLMGRDFDPQLGSLYALTEECTAAEKRNAFEGFLNRGLQGLQTEVWLQALGKEGPLIALLVELLRKGVVAPLGNNFEDALLSHAQALMRGEMDPVRYKEAWPRLATALPSALRENLLRNIRDTMIAATTPLGKLLALWGESLIREGALEEKGDDMVRRLARVLVERMDPSEIEWLSAAFKRKPAILSQCAVASREALTMRVTAVLRSTAADAAGRGALEELGRSLGIDPENLPTEEQEATES